MGPERAQKSTLLPLGLQAQGNGASNSNKEESKMTKNHHTVSNHISRRMAALGLSLALLLSGCGGGGDPETSPDGTEDPANSAAQSQQLHEFVDWCLASNELESFLPISSEEGKTLRHLTNVWDGLLTRNANNEVVPLIAERYDVSSDGMTFTFHLRDNVKWVNHNSEVMADLTSEDFLTSMEWILNFHKNGGKQISMLVSTVAGAQEYFDWTKTLSQEEAYATKGTDQKFLETVGIAAPDPTTVVYTLCKAAPYFHTVIMGVCGYPLCQKQVDEMGVEGVLGQNWDTMWTNGPYVFEEFISGNTKSYVPNEAYWDQDCQRFDRVTVRMVDDGTVDDRLFMTGEVSRCELSESNLRMIYTDETNEWHDYLVQTRTAGRCQAISLNFYRLNEDGSEDVNWNTAVNVESFRQAMRYCIDLAPYLAYFDFVNPESLRSETWSAYDWVKFSDGKDYAERIEEILGIGPEGRYDAAGREGRLAQAKADLIAAGVSLPVDVYYYVKSGDQTEQDAATILKQCFEEGLGTDLVNFHIGTYVTSIVPEVMATKICSFVTNGWGADYSDPENMLLQTVTDNDGAFYSNYVTNQNQARPETLALWEEYTRMVHAANAIVDDQDARYEAQAQAEAFMLDHALVISLKRTGTAWALTQENTYSHVRGATRHTDWETSTQPYTAEEYARLKADFEAGK